VEVRAADPTAADLQQHLARCDWCSLKSPAHGGLGPAKLYITQLLGRGTKTPIIPHI